MNYVDSIIYVANVFPKYWEMVQSGAEGIAIQNGNAKVAGSGDAEHR